MNYTPATNFAAKDALTTGNPAKIVKGTEISAEFNAISTAVNSKIDTTKFPNVSTAVTKTSAELNKVQTQDGTETWLSISGTNTIVATATPTVAAYATGQTFRFLPAASNTGAVTINVDGVGDKAITKSGSTALTAGDLSAGVSVQVTYDGTQFQLFRGGSGSYANAGANNDITSLGALTTVPAVVATYAAQVKGISASVTSNAMTVSASALSLDFRSTTLGSGAVTTVSGTPSNLVVPASATLGTVNAVQSDIYVLALNNAGTIELAVVNASGGVDLTETGLISTTAISGLAASASVVYSTTARTNVAYRIIGLIRSTQATAGTWATAPSLIQGHGGQALSAMSSLGYGQTWQTVTRTSGTTYYNTTGKPITLTVGQYLTQPSSYTITVNGLQVANASISSTSGNQSTMTVVIPPAASYVVAGSGSYVATELR